MSRAQASIAIRLLLAVAYPFLAHAAATHASAWLAVAALFDILLFVLIDPLLQGRRSAWLWLGIGLVLLGWLHRSSHALLPLMLVPVAFIAMIAWGFARTLRPGRVALITRLAAALEGKSAQQLAQDEPDVHRYSRNVTWLWAVLLGALALVNLVLALIAQPRGLLASLDIAAQFSVTEAQWSWVANWVNYGLMGVVFVLEFAIRQHRFPGRYRNAADFVRKLTKLPSAFWRDFLR